MQFLVHLETALPPELPHDERAALMAAEAERGRQLRRDGVIVSIWRLPGRLANVGIWDAPTPDELHDAVISLPLWRWMTVAVTPLARHPLMQSPGHGAAESDRIDPRSGTAGERT